MNFFNFNIFLMAILFATTLQLLLNGVEGIDKKTPKRRGQTVILFLVEYMHA
jgi:hypothetical protein